MEENTRALKLEKGICPECGEGMDIIDSGYDYDEECYYNRIACLECGEDLHVNYDGVEI